MSFWKELLANKILLAGLCAQLSSQVFKVIRYWIKEKRICFNQLALYGDFPSSHTAFIVGGTITAGITLGWASPIFALGVIFSAIVISDTIVQRRAIENTQKMLEKIAGKRLFDSYFRAHTILEILSGALIGIFWSVLISLL